MTQQVEWFHGRVPGDVRPVRLAVQMFRTRTISAEVRIAHGAEKHTVARRSLCAVENSLFLLVELAAGEEPGGGAAVASTGSWLCREVRRSLIGVAMVGRCLSFAMTHSAVNQSALRRPVGPGVRQLSRCVRQAVEHGWRSVVDQVAGPSSEVGFAFPFRAALQAFVDKPRER